MLRSWALSPRRLPQRDVTRLAELQPSFNALYDAVSRDVEFVSEARAASDSKQLGVGHAGAGGAARLASLPQPTFRFVTGEITTAAAEAECSVSSPAEVCQLSLKSSDPRCWHGL